MSGIELYAPRTARHRRTWTAVAVVLIVVFFILGQVATVFGIEKPLGFHQADMATRWEPTAIMLFGFGFTALLAFLWAWLFERRSPATLGFNDQAVRRYVRGIALGFFFIAAVVCTIWAMGGYSVENLGVWVAPTPALFIPLAILFAGFMVQGATEEILMRGWLMQLVASRHGVILAIVINSIVFSLLHAGNIAPSKELAVGLINIVLVAIFLSLYAVKEGSLWGVCAWHTAWNWLLGVGFGLEVSGEKISVSPIVIDLAPTANAQWWLTGAQFGPEASLVTSVILSAGVVYLLAKGAYKPAKAYSAPGNIGEADVSSAFE